MNYRRSRRQSKRSNRNRSRRRNRRGGGFQSEEVIEAFNEWARQNDRNERAFFARPEGEGQLIIQGKKKESDGVNNIMLGAYNIRNDTIEILQPDVTLPNTVLSKAQISDLLKIAVLKP